MVEFIDLLQMKGSILDWGALQKVHPTGGYFHLTLRTLCPCYFCQRVPCGPVNMSPWVVYSEAENI